MDDSIDLVIDEESIIHTDIEILDDQYKYDSQTNEKSSALKEVYLDMRDLVGDKYHFQVFLTMIPIWLCSAFVWF